MMATVRNRLGQSALRLKSVTGALVAVLLTTAPAQADVADPSDVLGAWTFQTSTYRGGQCLMSGTMRLTPAAEDGVYGCELTAMEVCSLWGRSLVRQSCEARRFGNQVSIRSQIEEMLESKMQHDGLQLTYVPDNFALTIQNAQRMFGSLVSAVSAPVEFRRAESGIS
ncbi:MAG: hypothetical protein AAGJ32_12445 [Pseudomonadota bacterium]